MSKTDAFYNGSTSRSAMFNDGDSDFLHFTPASAATQQRCTISAWVKRSSTGDSGAKEDVVFHAGTASGHRGHLRFYEDHINWNYYNGSSWILYLITTGLYRDTSAWYHLCANVDSVAGTAKLWVNGVEPTLSDNTIPSSSENMSFGDDVEHQIGQRGYGDTGYFDGYIADVHFINGSDLEYTEFAEFKNGVLIPKAYTGSYGTNGFHLEFKETGTGTASSSTVGADTSGNDNHFTSSGHPTGNILDNPENNFCTLNSSNNQASATLSEGNLKVVGTGANWDNVGSTFAVSSGKWYWEVRADSISESEAWTSGIRQTGFAETSQGVYASGGEASSIGAVFNVQDNNKKVTNYSGGTGQSSFTSDIAAGDVVQFRLNLDDNELSVSVDGSDKGKLYDITADLEYTPFLSLYNTSSATMNFGQNGTFNGQETAGGNADGNGHGNFFSAVPSGYLALCSNNLPEATIGPNSATQADDHFEATLYTSDNIGSGGTQNVTNVNFQPDLVWLKNRDSGSTSHTLFDSSRSTGGNNYHLSTDVTSAQVGANSEYGYLSAFNSNGFTLTGGSTNANYVNQSTDKYVAYNWKANGGTTTTNDASATGVGSIDSVYQANTTAEFSIVTYTGTGSAGTLAHGLGVKPDFILVKNTTGRNWGGYHHKCHATPAERHLRLNGSNALFDNSAVWNDTDHTNTLINVGTSNATNEASDAMVAYVFSEVEGFSKFGQYIGNGSTDGTFVYTGFRPSWIMTKRTDSTGNWYINDTARSPGNPTDSFGDNLYADLANGESGNGMEILSNGFKLKNTDASQNASSGEYIYMAFAEAPFKYANGR
tara:strand:+ start:615 stop:3089 length:2475 start_codon:yes stop_codon:yes gene_type:complete